MWSTQKIGATVAWVGLAAFLIGVDLVGNPNCPWMPWTDCGARAFGVGPTIMWAGLGLALVGAALAVARAGRFAIATVVILALGAGAFVWGTQHATLPDCSQSGECYQYPDPAGLIARFSGGVVVIAATVAAILASRFALRARAWTLAALLAVSAGTVYVFGATHFDYACGPHYVPGSVAGATVLECLENPWSTVALATASVLGALALGSAFLAWRSGRRAAQRVTEPRPAPNPPAPRS